MILITTIEKPKKAKKSKKTNPDNKDYKGLRVLNSTNKSSRYKKLYHFANIHNIDMNSRDFYYYEKDLEKLLKLCK